VRVIYIQHGNFAEAYQRLAQDLGETYFGQRYTIDVAIQLAKQCESTTILAMCNQPHDEMLDCGIRSIGINATDYRSIPSYIDKANATHIILRTPSLLALRHARRNRIAVLPIIADSFKPTGLRGKLNQFRIRYEFNHKRIQIISNHFISSCQSLAEIGVDPVKIVPHEFPRSISPAQFEPRTFPAAIDRPKVLFVGVVSRPKGVFDLIEACAILKDRGIQPSVTAVGAGAIEELRAEADRLGVEAHIPGRLANTEVIELLRKSDLCVIPSRQEYPEGMPHILFEAIGTRTPTICSDHSVFTPILLPDTHVTYFRNGDAGSLADAITDLVRHPMKLAELSANAHHTWTRLCIPTMWDHVVKAWLANDLTALDAFPRVSDYPSAPAVSAIPSNLDPR
jgi:glycosyltransferase involved in cell wall biosynthesis